MSQGSPLLAEIFNDFREGAVIRGNIEGALLAERETRYSDGEWCPRDCGSWVRHPIGGDTFEVLNDHLWHSCPARPQVV